MGFSLGPKAKSTRNGLQGFATDVLCSAKGDNGLSIVYLAGRRSA
jgi:hypothetical protein